MVRVDIGKKVDYETLERALVKAAEEVGWKADIRDDFWRGYRLGSVEEVRRYKETVITLRGKYFSAARISLDKDTFFSLNLFFIDGPPFGFASKRKIERYLEAVSKNLS